MPSTVARTVGFSAVSIIEAIVLGIVQGLTEFLPISSSGHLRIVPALLGWDDPGTAFTAVIQLGTMAAVVIYFWRDLWRIGTTWLASLRDPERRRHPDALMGWYLIVATIPIANTIIATVWTLVGAAAWVFKSNPATTKNTVGTGTPKT